MTSSKSLILLLIMASALLPAVPAQGSSTDTSVVALRVEHPPSVGYANTATAMLYNAASTSVVTTVQFTYGDGTPLQSPRDPPGSDGTGFQVILPANSYSNVTRAFVPPERIAGETSIEVRIITGGDTDPSNDTKALPVFVATPSITMHVEPPPALEVVPEGVTFLRYSLKNEGNSVDSVLMRIRDISPGWRADIVPRHDDLGPGESVNGTVVVSSETRDAGKLLFMNLSARSALLDAAKATDSVDVVLPAPLLRVDDATVRANRTIRLDGVPRTDQVALNETVMKRISVRNLGTATTLLRLEARIEAPAPGWTVNMSTEENRTAAHRRLAGEGGSSAVLVDLMPGERRTVFLNLTRSATAGAPVSLIVHASPLEWAHFVRIFPGDPYNATGRMLVGDVGWDLSVQDVKVPSSVYRGDRPTIAVHLSNDGRIASPEASLRVDVRDNVFAVVDGTVPVPALAPGASTVVTWSPDTANLSGAYLVTTRVVGANGDVAPANNVGSAPIVVRNPVLSVRAPETITGSPGETVLLAGSQGGLSVTSNGAHPELVDVRLTSGAPWFSGSWRLTVSPGATQALPLTIRVPAFPNASTVTGVLTATAVARDQRFTAETTVAFVVHDAAPPVVTLQAPTEASTVNQPVVLSVHAVDASGIARGEVRVRAPTGERTMLALEADPLAEDVYSAVFTPRMTGLHEAQFVVYDGSGFSYEATLDEVTWSVVGSPYAGLRPSGFGPTVAIRTRSLPFAEVAPGTTRSVEADTGEGFVPVGAPYVVVAPHWTDGPQTVHLRATSRDGVAWNQTFRVLLDTTPPRIEAPSVRPSAAGSFEVAVRAPEAVTVVVSFETETGAVEAPLRLADATTFAFSGTIDAPASWSRATLVAQDVAGNRQSVSIDLRKGSPVPDGGVLAAVSAMLLGLALMQRRREA